MYYQIISSSDVALWGVSPCQRVKKLLAKIDVSEEIDDLAKIAPEENILFIRVDYLFDANVLAKLTTNAQAILTDSHDGIPVAAWIKQKNVHVILKDLDANQLGEVSGETVPIYSPADLTGGYDPRLRKFDLSYVVHLQADHKSILEDYLYDKSYKGITDLVTKWCWPLPAKAVVHKCVNYKISPNMVTSFGWLLTIVAGYAFYKGQFFEGLLLGWLMTFLDTVDGKLARVTMQSSKIGHVMDHGLDIVHPPIWYWCWAIGLGIDQIELFDQSWSIEIILWFMFAAYVGGRIFEGLFQLSFNDISIFCWKPLDSYHRLITARRNPCMILFTVALLFADATQGFVWVVTLTIISTLFLALRFFYALLVRIISGPLTSWIALSNPAHINPSVSTKLFTGYPAIKTIKSIPTLIE